MRTASDFNLLYVLRSHDSELELNDMLFNADKSHFSSMNIKIHLSVMSAGQKRRLQATISFFHF